jgi:acyl carrier protein
MIAPSRAPFGPTLAAPILPATSAAYEIVEPQLRRLVADNLGVGLDVLVGHVSLRDDLAVDSLDLADLVLAIEAKFMIAVPQRALEGLHSYGDLVRASIGLICADRDAAAGTQ